MKNFYIILFFFISALCFGQETKANHDIDGFKLYPNPATNGKVYIQTAKNAEKKIFIYDVFGSKILETTIRGKELNVSDLDAGIYVLRVYENKKIATRKLIIK
ncbi:MAG: T9SS type A sorting domain-containing protein [Cellulophaga sp.]